MYKSRDCTLTIEGEDFFCKNIESLEIKFTGKPLSGINKYFIENVDFSLSANGVELISDKLKRGKNIFPHIIFPLEACKFTTFSLKLHFNNDIKEFIDKADVNLTFKSVVFKKQINKKLISISKPPYIKIENDSNIFFINNGQIYSKKIYLQENINKDTKYKHTLDKDTLNKGKTFELNGKKYFQWNMNPQSNKSFEPIIFDYDCSFYEDTEKLNCNYYQCSNNKFIIKHKLTRICDTMSDIKIYLPKINFEDDLKCYYKSWVFDEPKELTLEKKYAYYQIKEFTIENQFNLIYESMYGAYIILEINDDNNIDDIIENTKLCYYNYFWENNHRRKLCNNI